MTVDQVEIVLGSQGKDANYLVGLKGGYVHTGKVIIVGMDKDLIRVTAPPSWGQDYDSFVSVEQIAWMRRLSE